jgi:uncharacterized protein (TIGR03000 family)
MYRVVVLLALACGPGTALAPTYTEGGIPQPPADWWFTKHREYAGSSPSAGSGPAGTNRPPVPAPVVVYVPVYAPAPGPTPGPAPATLVVRLPADARLTVDGEPTRATGAVRRFASPPLAAGQRYHYELRAEVVRAGRTRSVRQRVVVQPGRESEVQLDLEGVSTARRSP